MTKILVVRHGESTWNAQRRIQGHRDSPLSPLGMQQAGAIRDRLRATPISAIYSSDLSRAVATISPLASALGLTVQKREALREKSYGRWEGLTPEEVDEQYPGEWERYQRCRESDPHFVIPGGETWEDVRDRTSTALLDIVALHGPNDIVVIATHGGTLRTMILYALGAPLASLFHMSVNNAGISRIDFKGGRTARVVFFNDTSHLEGVVDA